MKNEKYTNHFNLAAPVSRLTKLSFCIASVCFAYSYQSDIPMVKPSLDYLQNFERTKVYEDSLDIIDGNGTTYMDCSASIKRTEDRTISCGEDYTGSITQRRHIYGTGVITNGECRNTSDGKATNWSETSNTCVYTPVCTDEDSTVTKEECPRGYHGAITHTKTKRSIHFGKRVTPDVCSSEYQTTTQDSNSCDKDVNITDGGNKVTIPDGNGGKKIIDFSDEPIEESKVCNEAYELNGEAGQWVTFKRGGPSFWLPMYEDYISKYGVKKLYAEVFNAERNKTLKWMASTSKQSTKCIGLDNKFLNSQFADTGTNYIDHKISPVNNSRWLMQIYKTVYHNYDVKNTQFGVSTNDAIANNKKIELNSRRFNVDLNFNQMENRTEYSSTIAKDGGLFMAKHSGKSEWFHFNADDVNIKSDRIIGFWESNAGDLSTFRGDVTSNVFNAPQLKFSLTCALETKLAKNDPLRKLNSERIRDINIKKATLYSWDECTKYASNTSLDSYVNIDDLTLSSTFSLFEKTHFNGNIHNTTYVLSYGKINGDVDMIPEAGKTDGNYFISFGDHNGTVTGDDKSFLDLIPNESCSNISFGGVVGNWYNFKGGGNAFQLPLYNDYISQKGKLALFDKAMNAFQRPKYYKTLITQKTLTDPNTPIAINRTISRNKNDCAIFADEYRGVSNNNLVINDNTNNKSNMAAVISPNVDNNYNDISGENFVFVTDGSADTQNTTINNINVNYTNKALTRRSPRDPEDLSLRYPLFTNDKDGLITFNNLAVNIDGDYEIDLNTAYTRRFRFNKIDGKLIYRGHKSWSGEFVGNEANLNRIIFTKYEKDDGEANNISVSKLKIKNLAIIPSGGTFNGDIELEDGDLINYGSINGTYCIANNEHYLNNFNTINARNRCGENDSLELIPNEFCNSRFTINGDNTGWYTFKKGSPAFYKPFVMNYINKYGKADFYNWLYNSEYTNTYYLRYGETNKEKYKNKCLLMGNDFWDVDKIPTKDKKLNIVIRNISTGESTAEKISYSSLEWIFNAVDKSGNAGGAFNAYLNLDLKNVNWDTDVYKGLRFDKHTLHSDIIQLRESSTLGRVLHHIDADKILFDSEISPSAPVTLYSANINLYDGYKSILRLSKYDSSGDTYTVHIKEANVNSFDAGKFDTNKNIVKSYTIDNLNYKTKMEIADTAILKGNITNVYKNPDIYIKDYIYGTLNGNLKTNNEFYLYGTLNGDLWMRGGLSRKFDNFGTHNGQIHNYDDIGYKYD